MNCSDPERLGATGGNWEGVGETAAYWEGLEGNWEGPGGQLGPTGPYWDPQTYAEMDPTTAALEKEHEAVSVTPKTTSFPPKSPLPKHPPPREEVGGDPQQ